MENTKIKHASQPMTSLQRERGAHTFTRPENIKNIQKQQRILTSAFCLGEERQQITDAQPRASSKNMSLTSSSKAQASDFPSMIKANA